MPDLRIPSLSDFSSLDAYEAHVNAGKPVKPAKVRTVRGSMTAEQVIAARIAHERNGVSTKRLALDYGMSVTHMYDILKYKKWPHLKIPD